MHRHTQRHTSQDPVVPTDPSAYHALIQRGLVAGLSSKQIANALKETMGAKEQSVLDALHLLRHV